MGKFRIGEFEELLVLAVAGLGDDAYGITIQRRLEKQAERFVPLGAIYAALIRLEEKGLLKSKWGGTSGKRGGRRKRLYKVTEEGMTALAESRSVRETMWHDIIKLQPKLPDTLYKWPSVEESWSFYFPEKPYVELHRAYDDALHEAMIIYEMYRRGHWIFKPK